MRACTFSLLGRGLRRESVLSRHIPSGHGALDVSYSPELSQCCLTFSDAIKSERLQHQQVVTLSTGMTDLLGRSNVHSSVAGLECCSLVRRRNYLLIAWQRKAIVLVLFVQLTAVACNAPKSLLTGTWEFEEVTEGWLTPSGIDVVVPPTTQPSDQTKLKLTFRDDGTLDFSQFVMFGDTIFNKLQRVGDVFYMLELDFPVHHEVQWSEYKTKESGLMVKMTRMDDPAKPAMIWFVSVSHNEDGTLRYFDCMAAQADRNFVRMGTLRRCSP